MIVGGTRPLYFERSRLRFAAQVGAGFRDCLFWAMIVGGTRPYRMFDTLRSKDTEILRTE